MRPNGREGLIRAVWFGWLQTPLIAMQANLEQTLISAHPMEAKAMPQPSPPPCQIRLFRSSRDGDRLVTEPVRKKGLAALLDYWKPSGEEFPEIDDPPPAPKDIF